jgi:hypothetical protein
LVQEIFFSYSKILLIFGTLRLRISAQLCQNFGISGGLNPPTPLGTPLVVDLLFGEWEVKLPLEERQLSGRRIFRREDKLKNVF